MDQSSGRDGSGVFGDGSERDIGSGAFTGLCIREKKKGDVGLSVCGRSPDGLFFVLAFQRTPDSVWMCLSLDEPGSGVGAFVSSDQPASGQVQDLLHCPGADWSL